MAAHAVNHELGHGVERELARLGNQHVRAAHEQVGRVDRREDVLVAEGMHATHVTIECCRRKPYDLVDAVEVRKGLAAKAVNAPKQCVPHLPVISHVDKDHGLSAPHIGEEVLHDCRKELLLRACAANGEQVAHGAASHDAVSASRAVCRDVGDKFMVNVVTGVVDRPLGHGLELACRVHAAQLVVPQVGAGRLDGVDGALGKVKRHGPVVGDGVHHMGHACVHCCLRGPDVRPHVGDVLVDVAEEGYAELGVLLVRRVVRELTEALRVERLPHELVEGPHALRDS